MASSRLSMDILRALAQQQASMACDPKFYTGKARVYHKDAETSSDPYGDLGPDAHSYPACTDDDSEHGGQFDARGQKLEYGEDCYTPDSRCLGYADECMTSNGTIKLFCSLDGLEFPTNTPEICDGLDNDCDGNIDNAVTDTPELCANDKPSASPCYREAMSACIDGSMQCPPISDGTESASAELCDAIDNDCDGSVDEDFSALEQVCSEKDPATGCELQGINKCNDDGTMSCHDLVAVTAEEVCDHIDNDCDGSTEDIDTLGEACSITQDACTFPGHLACDADNPSDDALGLHCDSPAMNDFPFGDEVCDGIDNNCDGFVDNAPGSNADYTLTKVEPNGYNNEGVCQDPEFTCGGATNGVAQWIPTTLGVEPSPEVCDGLDNDCNTFIDAHPGGNPLTQNCQFDATCAGLQTCLGGSFADCVPEPIEGIEICDGIDNDCDGKVDNNVTQGLTAEGVLVDLGANCSNGEFGICEKFGAYTCLQGIGHMLCNAATGAQDATVEVCDGLDNDCNGSTDDNPADIGEACTAGFGPCETNGSTTCDSGTTSCSASPNLSAQTSEFCDHIDNDCNGSIDDIDCTPSCQFDIAAFTAAGIDINVDDSGAGSITLLEGDSTQAFFVLQNAETFTCQGLNPSIAPSADPVPLNIGIAIESSETFQCSVDGFGETTSCPSLHVTVLQDNDGDGIANVNDNCPATPNPTQLDFNNDGIGDLCGDADGDGIVDAGDNCKTVPNTNQLDSNGIQDADGFGDACEPQCAATQDPVVVAAGIDNVNNDIALWGATQLVCMRDNATILEFTDGNGSATTVPLSDAPITSATSYVCTASGDAQFGAPTTCSFAAELNQAPSITILAPTGKGNHPSGNGCTGADPYVGIWQADDPEGTAMSCQATFLDQTDTPIAVSQVLTLPSGLFITDLPSTNVPEFALGLGMSVSCTDADGVATTTTTEWHAAAQGALLFIAAHDGTIDNWSSLPVTLTTHGDIVVNPESQEIILDGIDDFISTGNIATDLSSNTFSIEAALTTTTPSDIDPRPTIVEAVGAVPQDRSALYFRAHLLRGYTCPTSDSCGTGSSTKSSTSFGIPTSHVVRLEHGAENRLEIDGNVESTKAVNPGTFSTTYAWTVGKSEVFTAANPSHLEAALQYVIVVDESAGAACP